MNTEKQKIQQPKVKTEAYQMLIALANLADKSIHLEDDGCVWTAYSPRTGYAGVDISYQILRRISCFIHGTRVYDKKTGKLTAIKNARVKVTFEPVE